jgi:hypothetical protein
VRLATLELAMMLLRTLVHQQTQCWLQDGHLAAIEGAREEATLQLRSFYKVWEKVVYICARKRLPPSCALLPFRSPYFSS